MRYPSVCIIMFIFPLVLSDSLPFLGLNISQCTWEYHIGSKCIDSSYCAEPLVCDEGACVLQPRVIRTAHKCVHDKCTPIIDDVDEYCWKDSTPCSKLPRTMYECDMDCSCTFGEQYTTECTIKNVTSALTATLPRCEGDLNGTYSCSFECRYCFQLEASQRHCQDHIRAMIDADDDDEEPDKVVEYRRHACFSSDITNSYTALCHARTNVTCLGARQFERRIVCSFENGYSWRKTLWLSIFFGGFGVDRFYLGDPLLGFFKLLSFGGGGVWTLIDIVLSFYGFLVPSDGSLFVDRHLSLFETDAMHSDL